MMAGVMSRMIPSTALVSAIPGAQDRGAFMSINASLQQVAGAVAAFAGGLIIVQKDNFSPLEHYDILGYIVVAVTIVTLLMVYRVSKVVKKKTEEKSAEKNIPAVSIEV
jgi:predicted MFS family arabinose efflux permease